MQTRPHPLETELAYYQRRRDELVARESGRFALIKGEQLIGVYDTLEEALTAGYSRFGLEPFLAKLISQTDETINLTTFLVTT